jgi:hypothetical protein
VILAALLLLASSVAEGPVTGLAELPPPVADYARRFEGECRLNGLGEVLANEMFSPEIFGEHDINRDGRADYLAYACMFGCVGAPFAFVSIGMPCPSGVLLLSVEETYRSFDLPGTVNKIVQGDRLRIVTTRRRFMGDLDCKQPQGCEYVYELRDGRFQRLGQCGDEGCDELLRSP